MLARQVNAPANREFEVFATVFKNFDGVSVIHAHKVTADQLFKAANGFFVNALREKRHVISSFFQNRFTHVLQHVFG